jgi:hypothetical protein
MDFKEKDFYKDWILSYSGNGEVKSIHLDELCKKNRLSRSELFEYSFEYFIKGCSFLKEMDKNNILFELHIELTSESNILEPVPKSIEKLISSIEIQGMPEFFLTSIMQVANHPLRPVIENYQSPIPFELDQKMELGYWVYYNAYRSMEEYLDNDPYSRWLVFSFNC